MVNSQRAVRPSDAAPGIMPDQVSVPNNLYDADSIITFVVLETRHMEFAIEWVSDAHYGTLVARILSDERFELFEDSRLGGCPIYPQTQNPRAADGEAIEMPELIAFYLKNKADVARFKIGDVVGLSRAGEADG